MLLPILFRPFKFIHLCFTRSLQRQQRPEEVSSCGEQAFRLIIFLPTQDEQTWFYLQAVVKHDSWVLRFIEILGYKNSGLCFLSLSAQDTWNYNFSWMNQQNNVKRPDVLTCEEAKERAFSAITHTSHGHVSCIISCHKAFLLPSGSN